MKIILSRKGFDSSPKYGQIPSPILPDGTILSLPLPANEGRSLIKYGDLADVHGHSVSKLAHDLTGGRITRATRTHFDPDLRRCMLPRRSGWRPLFGPHPSCHTHMEKQGVKEGDLILFFGWFRRVELANGTYRYVRKAPNLHVIFGWLQIDEIRPAGLANRKEEAEWAQYHPHFQGDWKNNYVYVSRKQLSLPRLSKKLPGGGAFETYSDALRLTAPPFSHRSIWKLPRSFYSKRGVLLSYHTDKSLWTREATYTLLNTRPKWQESVLHADECPEAVTWARRILTHGL